MYQKNPGSYKILQNSLNIFGQIFKKKKYVLYETSLRIINFKFEMYISLQPKVEQQKLMTLLQQLKIAKKFWAKTELKLSETVKMYMQKTHEMVKNLCKNKKFL